MCVPGTDVGIALNGPPVSVFGFGSQVSSWLTPPDRKMTSTRFCDFFNSAAEAGAANPPRPSAAVEPRNARRERWDDVLQA